MNDEQTKQVEETYVELQPSKNAEADIPKFLTREQPAKKPEEFANM